MNKTKFNVSFIHERDAFYLKIVFGLCTFIAFLIYGWLFERKTTPEFEILLATMMVSIFSIFALIMWLRSNSGLIKLKEYKDKELFVYENGISINGKNPKIYHTKVKLKNNNLVQIFIKLEWHYGSDLSIFQGVKIEHYKYKIRFNDENDYKEFEKWCVQKEII